MIFMEIINFKIDNNVNKYLKVLYFFFIKTCTLNKFNVCT